MDLNGQNTTYSQQAFLNKCSIWLALLSTKGHSECMIIIRRQEFQCYCKSRKIRNRIIPDNIPRAAYFGLKINSKHILLQTHSCMATLRRFRSGLVVNLQFYKRANYQLIAMFTILQLFLSKWLQLDQIARRTSQPC